MQVEGEKASLLVLLCSLKGTDAAGCPRDSKERAETEAEVGAMD